MLDQQPSTNQIAPQTVALSNRQGGGTLGQAGLNNVRFERGAVLATSTREQCLGWGELRGVSHLHVLKENHADMIVHQDPTLKMGFGGRLRYYIPQRDAKEHAGASGLPRLPAAELEAAVFDQVRSILRSPDLLADIVPRAAKLDPSLDEAKVTVAMTRIDAIWDQLFPAE